MHEILARKRPQINAIVAAYRRAFWWCLKLARLAHASTPIQGQKWERFVIAYRAPRTAALLRAFLCD
jgi:hypothetical protein